MFRNKPAEPVVPAPPLPHELALRDEVDPDPLIEEMVERLRGTVGGLQAVDLYGRPLSWRLLVRIAAEPTVRRLRDAQTSVSIADALHPTAAGSGPIPDGLPPDATSGAEPERQPAEQPRNANIPLVPGGAGWFGVERRTVARTAPIDPASLWPLTPERV
ncbi:MAG: hypothetical protein NVS3B26_18080 [Mycobacteriales bacterium]